MGDVTSVFSGPGPFTVCIPRNNFQLANAKQVDNTAIVVWQAPQGVNRNEPDGHTVPWINLQQDITIMLNPDGNWQATDDYTPDEGMPWQDDDI